nr:MAG TPA: hypothetical protein [Caudoviricetes sp.]
MIKTERGTTEIKGEISEILTDYEMIARAMKRVLTEEMGEEKATEALKDAIENSKMSEEERVKNMIDKVKREIVKNILGIKREE